MIHKLPQKVLESARRRLSHQKSKKSPMTTEILLKSFQSLNGFLVDTRFMDMALLAYAGFLRLDQLSNLRLKDVTPDPAYFELFIESSKTDQHVRVSLYHVVKTGADLCRWANLVNYASQPKLILPTSLNGGDDFLFGNIQTKSGTHFVRVGSKISCTTCREVLSKHLVDLGLQLQILNPFPGTTLEVAARLPRLMAVFLIECKRHGRWRSENVKGGYVADSIESRLVVEFHFLRPVIPVLCALGSAAPSSSCTPILLYES